jgi:hypothetical protein
MPRDCQHITALEVTHSKTAEEIQTLVEQMREKAPAITDYTVKHRVRLIKPTIGYDASALALSFVPAAGEVQQRTSLRITTSVGTFSIFAKKQESRLTRDTLYLQVT